MAYADQCFQYDASGLVMSNSVQGSGATAYEDIPSGFASGMNTWSNEQVEQQLNGMMVYTFTNYEGDTLLTDTFDGTQDWITYNVYDSSGNLIESAQPSAVETYDSDAARSWRAAQRR